MYAFRFLPAVLLVLVPLLASGQDADEARARVETRASGLTVRLAQACPLADPGDQAAFDRCRQALFRDAELRRAFGPVLLWGRPDPNPDQKLRDTTLTQFDPEIWLGLYASLFMFDGTWSVEYHDGEKLYRAQFGALFRNALAPGQYPYPFWHSAKKWDDYQNANSIVFWVRPDSGAFVAGQFFNTGRAVTALRTTPRVPPTFDGNWMWTDADGRSQPRPTLFEGLFRPDNPWLAQLEPAYRNLATAMRDGHCHECHVPNNPGALRRLVLLQTPAHAAAEIRRLMASVRDNKMPEDDLGLYREIDPATRDALLRYGAAFETLIDAARAWERSRTDLR